MSSILKKKYKKPVDLQGKITAQDYYAELKKVSKKLPEGKDIPFFYIPEFKFKPDPKSDEEVDIKPLLWVGEMTSTWMRILKPKLKYASGVFKAADDPLWKDKSLLQLTFEDGNGAKPLIAKKVERYVRKAIRLKVKFAFPTEDQEATDILEESTKVGASTTSPYTRIVQLFKQYQAVGLLQKMLYLVKLNELFEEWEKYDSSLKSESQGNNVEKIKDYLEKVITQTVTSIENLISPMVRRYQSEVNNYLNNKDIEDQDDKIDKLIQKIFEIEKLQGKIINVLKVINQVSGVSNWFSKHFSKLSDLKGKLNREEGALKQLLIKIEAALKDANVDKDAWGLDDDKLAIGLNDLVGIESMSDLPNDVEEALEEYLKLLSQGGDVESKAQELQDASLEILEAVGDLNAKDHPWVEALKHQVWTAKDELGEYLYDRDNYQQIQKLYTTFSEKRLAFDQGGDTAKNEMKEVLFSLVESLGIEIESWESEHLAFHTFEVKERSKRIEGMRRELTQFLVDDLYPSFVAAANPEEISDVEGMMETVVFTMFTNAKPYDDAVRKAVSKADDVFRKVRKDYKKDVLDKLKFENKHFKEGDVEHILKDCNEIMKIIDLWTIQVQRCDLDAHRSEYEKDQRKMDLIADKSTKYQTNVRDMVNLMLSLESNEEVIKELNKDIKDLEEELRNAKKTLEGTEPSDEKSVVMQIAKLRSDLIQKEEQLQAAHNLLIRPYQRLKHSIPTFENSLPKDMKASLDKIESQEVSSEIERILQVRISDHKLRFKTIIAEFEGYEEQKQQYDGVTRRKKCEDLLSKIYTAEQSLKTEDAFRDDLLEENPNYANLLPDELTASFERELETYKFLRMTINDYLRAILNTPSRRKPLREGVYQRMEELWNEYKDEPSVSKVYYAQQDLAELYENWMDLNVIEVPTETQDTKEIVTTDYKDKKAVVDGWVENIKDHLEMLIDVSDYEMESIVKIQSPMFDKTVQGLRNRLGEMRLMINVDEMKKTLTHYQEELAGASKGSPKKSFSQQMVTLWGTKVRLAEAAFEEADALFFKYQKPLSNPIEFAHEEHPIQALLAIKKEIEDGLKKIINNNLKALRDIEGRAFAAFGEGFDFYTSTHGGNFNVLSESKSDMISMLSIDIINRFNSLEAMGATKEELRASIEHIPVSCWPDEVLEVLQAWEKVESMTKANQEERNAQLKIEKEEATKAIVEDRDGIIDDLNDLISIGYDTTEYKDKLKEIIANFFNEEDNEDGERGLTDLILNKSLVKEYEGKEGRLAQVLIAIKGSKEIADGLKLALVTLRNQVGKEGVGSGVENAYDNVSSTIDTVVDNVEGLLDTWKDDDADRLDKALAVMTLVKETGASLASFWDNKEEAQKYIELVNLGMDGLTSLKSLTKGDKKGKKDKIVQMTTIVGSVTSILSNSEDGLLKDTQAGEVLGIATKVFKSIEIANKRLNTLTGSEKLSRKEIEERLKRTPDALRFIQDEVLGNMKHVVDVVGDVNQVMQIFGAAVDLAPGLSIASEVLGLAQTVLKMAKTIRARAQHVKIQEEAILYGDDDALALAFQQNVRHDNLQLAQQSTDAFAQVVSLTGSIVEVAGVSAQAGMALKYTGTAIKIGSKVVFQVIDEAQVLIVKDLIKKALAGDRKSKIQIFKNSAYYAKMYVIGLARDGAKGNERAESLAKEYCLNYGISDSTLKEETAELILRRIFRTSGERDDRSSRLVGGLKGIVDIMKKKITKLSGKKLIDALLEELKTDLEHFNTRYEELEDALKDVDDKIRKNHLGSVKMPLKKLEIELFKERDRLESLKILQEETPDDVRKLEQVQELLDLLAEHGL